MSIFASSTVNSLRAMAIAKPVAAAASAAEVLFVAGGKDLLHEAPRLALRATVERAAKEVVGGAAPGLAAQAARIAIGEAQAAPRTAAMVHVAGRALARGAAKQIVRSMGRAAGVGAALDGAVSAVVAVGMLRRGTIDRRTAATMVATESATGAAASALGVAAVAAVVALTGPVGFATAILVAGATSAGSKAVLGAAASRFGLPTG